MAIAVLWLCAWRAVLHTPWDGIAVNPLDTWSYLSWVQQYFHGAHLAGLLFTTEPHRPALWTFPLWLVGRVAAVTGLSPLGTYNVGGVVGAALAVLGLRRAGMALGMPIAARNWSTVALLIASGSSWVTLLAHKLTGWTPPPAADLAFLDLFPATTFVAYAYQAMGWALLSGVWFTSSRLENSLYAGALHWKWAGLTLAGGVLLGFSRPYEPAGFLAAYALKTAWHGICRRSDPGALGASGRTALVLASAFGPGMAWSLHVASLPVWSNFARVTMQLGLPALSWPLTLLGLALLCGLGVGPALRADGRRAALPIAAAVVFAAIVVLDSKQAKLASGLMLGPVILCGWGSVELLRRCAPRRGLVGQGWGIVAIALLLGFPSFLLVIKRTLLLGPALVPADVVALASEIPAAGSRPPLVLAGGPTAGVLPGLVGVRVWVGHWSLSPHYEQKIRLLERAGLDPGTPPKNPGDANLALGQVLGDAPFQYALLDRRCDQAIRELAGRGWTEVDRRPGQVLLRAPMPAK